MAEHLYLKLVSNFQFLVGPPCNYSQKTGTENKTPAVKEQKAIKKRMKNNWAILLSPCIKKKKGTPLVTEQEPLEPDYCMTALQSFWKISFGTATINWLIVN